MPTQGGTIDKICPMAGAKSHPIPAMGITGIIDQRGARNDGVYVRDSERVPYLPSLMQKLISHHSPTCSLCSSYDGLLLFLQNARRVSVSGPFRLPFPLPAELAPDFTGVSALMLPHQTGLLTTLCEAGPLPLSILLLVFF